MLTIDLKQGGVCIAVTEGSKEEYIDFMVECRISRRVKDQSDQSRCFYERLQRADISGPDHRVWCSERELELPWHFQLLVVSRISTCTPFPSSFLYLRLAC